MNSATKSKKQSTVISGPKKGLHGKKASAASGSMNQSRMNFSVMNRSMIGTSSRKSINVQAESKAMDKGSLSTGKHYIQVYDDQGKNVTPRPLFCPEPGTTQSKQSKIFTSQESSLINTSEILSSFSLYQTGINVSFAGPFTRSTFGGSSFSKSSISTAESVTDEIEVPAFRRDTALSTSDIRVKREDMREYPIERDLNKVVDIYLTDTEMIWFLDIPPLFVSMDSEEAAMVKLQNLAYLELCKNRAGNDQYITRMMQTFNGAPKNKEVQCDKIVMEDAAAIATSWDLYDSINVVEETKEEVIERHSTATSVASSKSDVSKDFEGTMSLSSTGRDDSYSSSIMDVEKIILTRRTEDIYQDTEKILKSEKFHQDLFFMERVIIENIFQAKLAAYRQLPIMEEQEVAEEVEVKEDSTDTLLCSLDRLWSFACELTKGHNDLLAVGYGQFEFAEQKEGLACCWSLKNTMWPERIFHCESGVTALDFSAANPNLLAVGMYNGVVAIYNVQNNSDTPVLDCSDSVGKHTSPVWQLKWTEQDRVITDDKGEALVSISADGRIARWHIRKGLDSSDLMKLKRTGTDKYKKLTNEKERKAEAFISRQAPGMCFDFHPKETNIYLAGTEEGYIHKCSCSYNEQFLDSYKAHKGPIYKIAWSPFCHDVFLSCSADWNIYLWRQDILKPILSFSASTEAVHDIKWSPTSALVFGAVNDSRVEIWDLSVNILDPVIVSFANPGVKMTTLLFTKEANCVLVGDSDGQVSVYELRNVSGYKTDQVEALYDIIRTTLASQL
ncbi:dynein axonemal intermediate chain 4 isoform X2 [Microcaecilia unicolor]|uniref:Dynein axonemal intermediate chain 4 n=1 Tax=Microcaecilia unicolor TaxID=1415580 RepID=A0A6P7YDN1_9AMPH|nr:WD repeat-containing protein 78 isoform X2 [Microcaecilia unicolor]